MLNNDYIPSTHLQLMYDGISNIFKKMDKSVDTIAHYTSTQVLDSLLSKATFWASNIFFLNDKNEYKTGMKIIEEAIGNKSIPIDLSSEDLGIYTISFSDGTDLLQQWITYAKESGVSLEFDSKLLLTDQFAFDSNCIKPGLQANDVMHLMLYNDEIRRIKPKRISTCFSSAIRNEDKKNKKIWNNPIYRIEQEGYLRLLASYIKDKGFKVEKEIRASFIPGKNEDYHSNVKYLPKNNGVLRPYIEVKLLSDYNNQGIFTECLPLKSITVGPSGNQQAVFDSVVHRFKYGEKKVYNYYEKDINAFRTNFLNYFWEALKRALEETSKKTTYNCILTVFNKLWIELEKELENCENYSITTEDIKKQTEEYNLSNYVENSNDLNLLIKPNDLFAYIKNDNYFSKEGIWIKKSKIPYIF